MPLYELFAVAKPALGKAAIGSMMKAVASKVMEQGGVVTDLRSYGERKLAYDIRQPNVRFAKVRGRRAVVLAAAGPACMLDGGATHHQPSGRVLTRLLPVPHLQASMWQINFAANPKMLSELDHTLRVDERMLRWLVLKRLPYTPLPSPYSVARTAENVAGTLAKQQQAALKRERQKA
jgi:small subunit ribosomal protein S6